MTQEGWKPSKICRSMRMQDYSERAAYAERMALGAREANTKRQLLEVAARWRVMADRAERFGRRFLADAPAAGLVFTDLEDPFILWSSAAEDVDYLR